MSEANEVNGVVMRLHITEEKIVRKIIQIATDSQPSCADWNAWVVTTALCDDGTLWELEFDKDTGQREWVRLPQIPQSVDGI